MGRYLAVVCGAALLIALPGVCGAFKGEPADPEAVHAVHAGESDTADAAWWGFDAADSTRYVQAALNSPAATVRIPYQGAPWVVRPLQVPDNKTILLDPGVVIQAKRGEYRKGNDSVFNIVDRTNVTLRGYGARIEMWKDDYQSYAYTRAEWRMGIRIQGSTGVMVEGLEIVNTGGDGVYLGTTARQTYCKDVVLRNLICRNNLRQGISVVSAENLLIDNCLLEGTSGTEPAAGLDLEPNKPHERLVNCVIRNSIFRNNAGAGMMIYLSPLRSASETVIPVSIRVENCLSAGNQGDGFFIGALVDGGPKGLIEFDRCTTEQNWYSAVSVYGKSADAALIRFRDCNWKNDWRSPRSGSPLNLFLWPNPECKRNGGLVFVNCGLWDDRPRPPIAVDASADQHGVFDITGSIRTLNSAGAMPVKWGAPETNVTLAFEGAAVAGKGVAESPARGSVNQ